MAILVRVKELADKKDPQHLFSSYKRNNQQNLSHFRTAYHNRILSIKPYINLAYVLLEFILFTALYICSVKIIIEKQYFLSVPVPSVPVPTGAFSFQVSPNVLLSATLPPIALCSVKIIMEEQYLLSVPVPTVPVPTGAFSFQVSPNILLSATLPSLAIICIILL